MRNFIKDAVKVLRGAPDLGALAGTERLLAGNASGSSSGGYTTPARLATYLAALAQTISAIKTFSVMPRIPVATVAAAGANQAAATALVEGFSIVTGADDAKGVRLPTAVAGAIVLIKVGDGADLKVYPATGAAINGLAADAAITVVDDVCFMLVATSATQWYSLPLLPS